MCVGESTYKVGRALQGWEKILRTQEVVKNVSELQKVTAEGFRTENWKCGWWWKLGIPVKIKLFRKNPSRQFDNNFFDCSKQYPKA